MIMLLVVGTIIFALMGFGAMVSNRTVMGELAALLSWLIAAVCLVGAMILHRCGRHPREERVCPFCREWIDRKAALCPHCREPQPELPAEPERPAEPTYPETTS